MAGLVTAASLACLSVFCVIAVVLVYSQFGSCLFFGSGFITSRNVVIKTSLAGEFPFCGLLLILLQPRLTLSHSCMCACVCACVYVRACVRTCVCFSHPFSKTLSRPGTKSFSRVGVIKGTVSQFSCFVMIFPHVKIMTMHF